MKPVRPVVPVEAVTGEREDMMNALKYTIPAVLLMLCACTTGQAAPTSNIVRADGNRVPVTLFGDWSGGSCPGTLILSHGMGGSEDGLAYAAKAAVEAGYRAMVIGHKETGPRALLRVMRSPDRTAEIRSDEFWRGRQLDLAAALDFATAACRPSQLVLGGHSMGAALTMIEAGADSPVVFNGADRFDAYVAISPQGVGWAFESTEAWDEVDKPVLMVTGTRDDGFDGKWTDRLVAFENLPDGKKRLVVITGADHMNLGGRRNQQAQTLAARAVTEFLGHLENGWTPSALASEPGVEVREK